MLRYIANRVLTIIPTLFVVSVVVFGLQQMLPGDAAIALAGENMDPAIVAQIRAAHHLDQPIVVQYALWLGAVLHGDLGLSLRNNVAVAQLIGEKLPATAILSVMAMVWAVLIGVPAGIVSALHKGRGLDYLANVIGLAGLSVPPFWLGLMLILFVSVKLGLLPASGYVESYDRSGRGTAVTADAIVRTGHQHRRGDDAPHPQRDGHQHGRRLHPHSARQGTVRAPGGTATWSAQCAAAVDHHGNASGRPTPRRAVLTEQVFTIPGFGRLIIDAVYPVTTRWCKASCW